MKFDSPSSDFPNQLVKTELEREEFLDFLEELATIEPNGQYLTFSDSNKYVVNIKSMLIRDCYVSLCDRLIELILRDNVVSDNNHRIHITGKQRSDAKVLVLNIFALFRYDWYRQDGIYCLYDVASIETSGQASLRILISTHLWLVLLLYRLIARDLEACSARTSHHTTRR